LAEALANGAKTLVTTGGIQSNHCRQTAALAARYGLECIVVLSGEEPELPSGNLLLDSLFGAKIIWTTRPEREAALQKAFDEAWEAGKRPMLIPLGASNPTGSLGYVFAFDELLAQDVQADWMIVASSSGGTQAGLALGARRANWKGHVLGISIDAEEKDLQIMVSGMASDASERFGKRIDIKPEEILVNADYLGAGYAIMGEVEIEAINLFASLEGLLLGPVYTARAAAGMIDLIRKGFFKPDETVLFWHTGGTPELFANPYDSQLAQHQGRQTG
jgi:1-aminocyclopropane-1-carboxylate deaminase/D-cysteine desulfhydrase-like pyridoxal-dependent ACC family enzyme